ncbi:MAG: tetratricopeptide repeat protein [Balneolaceae bacterium]|nr:tetratricopeptide repeat protein [Balneolaceae bacterium]MBO6545630.1 tetratricopeptide repeat protein [Balneolaceae bacterium]MBO6647026.1 tetratricopeptide repeat protein [Balneolaceae bacterium]
MPEKNNLRLLAAIMFADMVGYTRLMQEDEQKAKDLRDRQREVIDGCILKHRGQVMQYYGDGTLSMFGSALDAVNCAKEIQLLLAKTPKVPLRIGIHIGDVVYDDEGIYGDAVNIAARVQSLGIPGSIMISGKVFDEVKNHPGIKVQPFGEHDLKNVFNPVSIFAVANKGLEVPEQAYIQDITGSNKNSVAVLPFVNFSPDPQNEYFSDGITEEIINSLVKVKGLQVASRTSVFSFKNTQKDIREIGRELNVATVLEGSVRQAGNRVRVTAQLIKTEDGFHIWSENFDREMKDIFGVQDEIAQKIADKLEANFTFDTDRKLYEASTNSIVAYNAYLQGLYYWNKRTPESVYKAIEFYEEAIQKCKTYTNAFSGLANAYSFLGVIGHMQGKEAFSKAEKYSLKAIELNNSRADSFIALGYVNMFYHWDFDAADSNLRKGITLEPENEEGRAAFSLYNRIIGRFDKMLVQAKAAVKIAPLSLPALNDLARSHALMKNYKEALKIYDKIIDLDPNYRAAYEGKAYTYIEMEKFDKAEVQIKKYIKQIKGQYKGGTQLGYLAAIMGDKKEARKNLKLVEKRQREQPDLNLSLDFAVIYAGLGEKSEMFKHLNNAVDEKLGAVVFINSIPAITKYNDDPRYIELLERIGLPNKSLIS